MADVRMRWRKNGSVIAMIQIENQSEINNIMPIRDLGYIFNNYNEQIKEHRRENERNGKRFYARELGDDERLQPVITFVLYYGKEEWKRPLSILDMLDLEPEILILDEVLSVGDKRFRKKCEARIQSMFDKGVTVLFVSHSTDQVLRMCNKGILLEHGRLVAQGEVEDIVDLYDEKLGMERED